MRLRNTLQSLQDRIHRVGSRSPRPNHNNGAQSPASQVPTQTPTTPVDHLTPQAVSAATTRAPSPVIHASVQALTPPSPVRTPVVAAEVVPPPVAPQYKYMNARALLSATDTWIGAVEDSKSLTEINDTLSHAREDLETVHPRIVAQKGQAATRIAEAAIARAAAALDVGSNEADIATFDAHIAALGVAPAPADWKANLRILSLISRTDDTLDTCAEALTSIAKDVGAEPVSEDAKTARQALIDNLKTWVELAPFKLPPALPYQLTSFNAALAALSAKTKVPFSVELDMPSDADNLKAAEDLYKHDVQDATANDAALAQQLANQHFGDW